MQRPLQFTMEVFKMKIGEVIRKYRKEHKLTQEDMATRLGVTAPAVNKWEHGNTMPDIALLAPIARLLDISLDELLSFHSELTPEEICGYIHTAESMLSERPYSDVLFWVKELIYEYPNSDILTHNLVSLMDNYSQTHALPDDPKQDALILNWYKQGLHSSEESISRASADSLFKYYARKFQYEEAIKYLYVKPELGPMYHLKQAELYEEAGNQQMALQSYEQFLLDTYHTLNDVFTHLTQLKLKDQDPDGASYYVEKRKSLSRLFEMGNCSIAACNLDMVSYRKNPDETIAFICYLMSMYDSISDYTRSPLYSHILFDFMFEEHGKRFCDVQKIGFFMSTLNENEKFAYMKGNPAWSQIISPWSETECED